ncbi:MAG: hypothetical protein RL007_1197 [Bacteroidota bacterium]|jgi:hypothetical protein
METTQVNFVLDTLNDLRAFPDKIISENCTMDPIRLGLDFSAENCTVRRLWCTANVTYNENGRNDSFNFGCDFEPRFGNHLVLYNFPNDNFRGGKLTLQYHAILRNIYTHQDQQTDSVITQIYIRAVQPAGRLIREVALPELAIVAYLKSKFSLFNEQNFPVFENGFGLFRTEPADPGHIWNWKNNLAHNTSDYIARKAKVKRIPEELRSSNPSLYKRLPDFTEEQLKIETWQSYGTGAYYKPERSGFIFKSWNWIPAGGNDGFADACKTLEVQVAQGNPPVNW